MTSKRWLWKRLEIGKFVLLEKAIAGDAEAFSALLEEYYLMIYQFAYKWVGNQSDAEDVAQEVCVKLARVLRTFRQECKFSTWLYRIVMTTATDYLRRKPPYSDGADVEDIMFGSVLSAEDAYSTKQIWQHVRGLPDRQREAVLLVYAQELSHREVAEIMECQESTISWYIHEAKKQLREVMEYDGR